MAAGISDIKNPMKHEKERKIEILKNLGMIHAFP